MRKVVPILSLVLGVVLIIIAVTIPSGSEKDSFIRMAKMVPDDIRAILFVDAAKLQDDKDMAATWNAVKSDLLGEDIYGENVSKLNGLGLAGSAYNLTLYDGDFDLKQVKSVIEQGSTESFEYEGVTVWTDQNASSAAVIDDTVFVGSSEDIKLCIDVANGHNTSLYDNKNAKDTIGRLPSGYILGVVVMGAENSSQGNYTPLTAGMAVSKDGGNISQTSLLKFRDSDTAQGYLSQYESQIPSSYDVTQDGEYVSIVVTSKVPGPGEEAYNSVNNDLQSAVDAYVNKSGMLPTINGTVNISGYDLKIVDICALLKSEGGLLSEVPAGVASVDGPDNDNCDAGCEGCLSSNHYIWAIDDAYGYVYSVCVGANCSEYNMYGYQGVWP